MNINQFLSIEVKPINQSLVFSIISPVSGKCVRVQIIWLYFSWLRFNSMYLCGAWFLGNSNFPALLGGFFVQSMAVTEVVTIPLFYLRWHPRGSHRVSIILSIISQQDIKEKYEWDLIRTFQCTLLLLSRKMLVRAHEPHKLQLYENDVPKIFSPKIDVAKIFLTAPQQLFLQRNSRSALLWLRIF